MFPNRDRCYVTFSILILRNGLTWFIFSLTSWEYLISSGFYCGCFKWRNWINVLSCFYEERFYRDIFVYRSGAYNKQDVSRYRKALDTAMKISTIHNIPPISGTTIIIIDVTESYSNLPCHGAKALTKKRTVCLQLLYFLIILSIHIYVCVVWACVCVCVGTYVRKQGSWTSV